MSDIKRIKCVGIPPKFEQHQWIEDKEYHSCPFCGCDEMISWVDIDWQARAELAEAELSRVRGITKEQIATVINPCQTLESEVNAIYALYNK
jgi:hypothetical protein